MPVVASFRLELNPLLRSITHISYLGSINYRPEFMDSVYLPRPATHEGALKGRRLPTLLVLVHQRLVGLKQLFNGRYNPQSSLVESTNYIITGARADRAREAVLPIHGGLQSTETGHERQTLSLEAAQKDVAHSDSHTKVNTSYVPHPNGCD